MNNDDEIELVRGSGNAFKDFDHTNADIEQNKAILAARAINILDERGLSLRKAAALTGFQHADFSRIRKVDLGRFTLDKLIKVVNALDAENEVFVDFRPRHRSDAGIAPEQPQA